MPNPILMEKRFIRVVMDLESVLMFPIHQKKDKYLQIDTQLFSSKRKKGDN